MRKRFYKTGRPFNQTELDFGDSLREVFLTFGLNDFRDEIVFWLELSLTNDRSAYFEGKDREDVMDFCNELMKLVEAFYMVSVTNARHKEQEKVVSVPARTTIRNKNQSLLVKTENSETPDKIITQFRELFSSTYVDLEMLDLLDSVITYEGVKQVNRQNLILFYECIRYLIACAYNFQKKSSKTK